jgi:hypothetical protein
MGILLRPHPRTLPLFDAMTQDRTRSGLAVAELYP